MTLTVVVTVHNNENLIKACLDSVSFADEIIVVDNQSSDKTAKIATRMGAVVISHKNNPEKLNESKNFGFKKATSDWILSLDSDERVEPDLQKEIQFILTQKDLPFLGYKMPRHNIIFGKVIEHGLWYPDYVLRLFKKGHGSFANIHNHELLEIKGEAGTLKGHIEHLNYHSISQYIQKIDRQYSINEVNTFLDNGGKVYWYDAIRFPMHDFLANYFARQGYKDGLHGLVLSILQAFYMFVIFAKIWEKQGFKEKSVELSSAQKELTHSWKQVNYWYLHEQGPQRSLLQQFLLKIKYKLIHLFV